MDSLDHSLLQVPEASHLASPPPLPPRSLYVNLHIREERPSDSYAERNQPSSPSLQTSTRGPNRRKKGKDRLLYEDLVQFTFKEYVMQDGFLEIYGVGLDGRLARMEVFDRNKSLLCQIPFSGVSSVKPVEFQGTPSTIVTLQNGYTYIFSSSNNKQLFGYCKLLCKLPDYAIPEMPKCHLVSQQHVEQFNDPIKYDAIGIWVVYLINEGIAPRLHLDGLHFVTIQPANSSSFNVYDFYSRKHCLAWERCNIRRAGRYGSLVFLEVNRSCRGGPGVLWMSCPDCLATQFRESLHKFLHEDTFTEPISIDSHQNGPQLHFVLDQDRSEKPPVCPPKPFLSAPVLVSSYADGDERELQGSDEHPTEECIECTSTEFQHPIQDESSNLLLSENLLHSPIILLQ